MWRFLFSTALAASPINVLIIDTGLSSSNKELLSYVSAYDEATHDHGPVIASIILSGKGDDWVCKNVKITACHYGYDQKYGMAKYVNCLNLAINNKYDYVNMSINGEEFNPIESTLIEQIVKKSTVVVAAGNSNKNILYSYPAGYISKKLKNFKVITNLSNHTSNYGDGTIEVDGQNIPGFNMKNEIITMSGTSMSAARYTHMLIKKRCNDVHR